MSNKNINQEQQVIFMHIPKTAGFTLQKIIERQYPPQSLYTLESQRELELIAELKNMSQARRAEIRMLQGHLNMSQKLHEFLPGPATYCTMLRDPVERVISHYYFVRDTPGHYLQDFATEKSLKELLESRQVLMLNDTHVRLLSGVWGDLGFGECTQETLETAKRNLREHFSVVGLTERFDETLLLLKSVYGWQNVYYTRKNVTPNRPARDELPPDDLEAIIEANPLDVQLYQYATTLFEEQLRQQGPLFPLKVKAFQSINRLHNSRVRREIRKRSLRMFIRRWSPRTFIRRWSLRVFIRKWARRILDFISR
jgi:hypothetical protein